MPIDRRTLDEQVDTSGNCVNFVELYEDLVSMAIQSTRDLTYLHPVVRRRHDLLETDKSFQGCFPIFDELAMFDILLV